MDGTDSIARDRVRERGDKIPCPKCGHDAFVYCSRVVEDRAYPAFMRQGLRIRYYRCGNAQCRHTWKTAEQVSRR